MSTRKNLQNVNNYNQDICNILIELAAYEQNVNKNRFKSDAYRQAACILAVLDKRIASGAEAQKLKGIGQKIAKKIDEYLKTGKLQKLENIHKDATSEAILLLSRVSGIGPAKAHQLVLEGVTSLEQLEQHQTSLNHHQLIGLRYFHEFEKKIPRDEIGEIEKNIKKQLYDLDPNFHITICGSYRRGQDTSGDIDVLVSHPTFKSTSRKKDGAEKLNSVIHRLESAGLITDTISKGDIKFMGVCWLPAGVHRRLDIRLCPWDQYFCSVLYFTGSDLFNKNMRTHALQHNFTLNEYQLRPIGSTGLPGEPVPISSEEDIFQYIDYPYRRPQDRIS